MNLSDRASTGESQHEDLCLRAQRSHQETCRSNAVTKVSELVGNEVRARLGCAE